MLIKYSDLYSPGAAATISSQGPAAPQINVAFSKKKKKKGETDVQYMYLKIVLQWLDWQDNLHH